MRFIQHFFANKVFVVIFHFVLLHLVVKLILYIIKATTKKYFVKLKKKLKKNMKTVISFIQKINFFLKFIKKGLNIIMYSSRLLVAHKTKTKKKIKKNRISFDSNIKIYF